jgi:DNA replication protein DnaC
MDIDGALNEMSHETKKFTTEDIDRVQEWMISQGYQNKDARAHRMLANFLAHRKHDQAERGILFCGRCGVGKTLWLRKFAMCRIVTAAELTQDYCSNRERYDEILRPPTYRNFEAPRFYFDLAIDDLGKEPKTVDFGTRLEVMADTIAKRYEMWISRGAKTYISTNMSISDIAKRYGEYIDSRLHEMTTHITFTCKDQRKRTQED